MPAADAAKVTEHSGETGAPVAVTPGPAAQGTVDRFAFGALVLLSIALLVVGRANVQLLEGIGTTVGDTLVPALSGMTQPISSSRRLVERIGELVALRAEMLGCASRTCACSNGRAPRAS